MGHRANYVIREDGKTTLYYSHWGALSVPEDVFWGPTWAEEFIRGNEEVADDGWLDDVWGEGGVALNKDTKTLTLFGGNLLGYPPLQPIFLALMQALWEKKYGWHVTWAEAGMPAIAAAVGVDPTIATAEPLPPQPAEPESIGQALYDPEDDEWRIACLVTFVREDGALDHRVSDVLATAMLANGPEILETLQELPDLVEEVLPFWQKPDYFEDEPWSLGDEFSSSIIIDIPHKRLAFRELYAARSAGGFLSNDWQGWDFRQFEGDITAHFERLGVEIPAALQPSEDEPPTIETLSEDDLIQQVADALLNTERPNHAESVRAMAEEASANGEGEVWINPHATVEVPESEITADERARLFGEALAAMLSGSLRSL